MISEATAPGFRICLLVTDTCLASGRVAYRVALFEGGSIKHDARGNVSRFSIPDQTIAHLRHHLLSAAPPYGRIFTWGSGWRDLLAQILPSYAISDLKIVSLRDIALALREELRARASLDQILQAFGLGVSCDTGDVASTAYEELLWAVLKEMTRRNLVWSDITRLLESRIWRPSFHKYSFDRAIIEAAPQRPGVYVMTDGQGRCLYVGKSADLRRRLGDYFRAAASLPAKVVGIRERIRHLEWSVVGSELEALLLEHRLITERRPELNVQRRVAERSGIYQPPVLPVAIICPSAQAHCVELFLAACNDRAIQARIRTERMALKSLAKLLQTSLTGAPGRVYAPTNVTDWGTAGNEICCRYFGRFRDKLQWLEIDGSVGNEDMARRLFQIARLMLKNPPEPGEFRLGES